MFREFLTNESPPLTPVSPARKQVPLPSLHWLHQPEDPMQDFYSEVNEIVTAHIPYFATTVVAETTDFQRLWWPQGWVPERSMALMRDEIPPRQ